MQIELAQSARDLTELFREPALTVACVLLIVTSVGWIVVTRLIVRQITRAALRTQAVALDMVRPPKDIWAYPPPPPAQGHVAAIGDSDLVVAVDDIYIYDFSGEDDVGSGGDASSGAHGGVASHGGTAPMAVVRLDEPERAL